MNVPQLRFPSYKDSWNNTLLSTLMTFNNGINADKASYGGFGNQKMTFLVFNFVCIANSPVFR